MPLAGAPRVPLSLALAITMEDNMLAKLAAPLGALTLLAACSDDSPREALPDLAGPCVHSTGAACSHECCAIGVDV